MKFFFDYERPELAEIFNPPFRATQIYKSVYQRRFEDFERMTDLPKPLRADLAEQWEIRLPAVHRRFDSSDGTRRYLVRLKDGEFAETVFIPEENRNTICISSQIGCALDCKFCLTGQLGLTRHLSAGRLWRRSWSRKGTILRRMRASTLSSWEWVSRCTTTTM